MSLLQTVRLQDGLDPLAHGHHSVIKALKNNSMGLAAGVLELWASIPVGAMHRVCCTHFCHSEAAVCPHWQQFPVLLRLCQTPESL